MINFIKKYQLLIFLSFLLGILIFIKIFLRVSETGNISPLLTPTPTISISANLKDIIPGKTTKNELDNKLGQPIKIEESLNYDVYSYLSENKNWPNQIYVPKKEDKVSLIKEYFPQEKYSQFIEKYGQPEKELYNSHSQAGFSVFVFAQKGVAITADSNSEIVLEVWYFSPTTLEDFLSTLGKDLTLSPSQRF